ncbi:S-methyl-5'-thioadenosine phosphorylase [Parashewanella spongiae]|uniref:Purine nucleoside phosphorylase n=1 Tax=Parashewanella spongiae TaxID=342950 RepID=A0A3A6UGK8_9GAMM|nr:S-methyl-5'-thioadenosine phosphorylase [Parashewanella spongiae]MCL1077745.1 S-methyl-5'-thioadenosine phosphorylase [Parashewanella spongiae]RJY18054.1 S-methyl-5'-thioadenosine phosphorylase [Parashewanella spongiae]
MLAVIGGTGIYNIDGLITIEKHDVDTPYGKPSAEIVRGVYHGKEILFLPRHGSNHSLLPSEVNYQANIWSLKSLGVKQVIGLSAVGSLQQDIKPGDLAIADQYFDFIKNTREKTFFGNGLVAHVSTAEPTCKALADALSNAAEKCDISIHRNKTYACVDGPRLGTKAESLFLKNAVNADLVGMTNVPEVFLAREAQICYCTIGIATDYDCWQDDPKEHVTVEQVISRYGASLERAKLVLETYIKGTSARCSNRCNHALESAVLTPTESMTQDQKNLFEVLST